MKNYLFQLGLITSLAWGTTTIIRVEPTATQAIVVYQTDQPGNCTVQASEGTNFSGGSVNDVNTALFVNSNSDARGGSIPGGTLASTYYRQRKFVLGTRAAQVAATGRRESRALQNSTQHIVGVTCGSDAQVTSLFTTAPLDAGVTFQDARFDRSLPGQYAYPSIDYTNRNKLYKDPWTGTQLRLGTFPGDLMGGTYPQTFATPVSGTGWTGLSYSGTSQGYLYLPTNPISTANGSTPVCTNCNVDYGTITVTLSGTASSVDVYLTLDGTTPVGAAIVQGINSTPTVYTIGSNVPVFDAWRSGPLPPAGKLDIASTTGTLTKSGSSLSWTGGSYFRPYSWHSGTTISLSGTPCAVTTWVSDFSAILASSSCVADGTYSFSVTGFGFLIRNHANTNTTVVVASPTWILGASGQPEMPSAGFLNDITQAVQVTNGSGTPGYLIAPSVGYGPPNNYNTNQPIYFVSSVDGTAGVIGLAWGNTIPTGFSDGSCGGGNLVFDGLVGGRFYCAKYSNSNTKFGLFYVQYSGNYSLSPPQFSSPLANSASTTLTQDLNALVQTFDTSGAFTTYYNQVLTQTSLPVNWGVISWEANGTNGALLLQARTQADAASWWAVWSLDTNSIIATMCSYCGASGALNRWNGDHSGFGARQYPYLVDTINDACSGFGNISCSATYFTVGSTGTLGPAPWSACPTNPFGASGNNCSTVSISTLTPVDSLGNSLAGTTILNGDYFAGGGECYRIVALSGLTATLFRNQYTQYSAFGECGQTTTHPANLTLKMYPSGQKEIWWNWVGDPHGNAIIPDPISADCHYGYSVNTNILGCVQGNLPYASAIGKPIRLGGLPGVISTAPFFVNHDPTFATATPFTSDNYLQTHPSLTQILASTYGQGHYLDGRPDLGFNTPSTSAIKVGTYTYRIPAAALSTYSYRIRQWLVTTNTHPAVDVSGPSSVIVDTSSGWFTYCNALIAGECWPGSSVGDTYVNFPYVSTPSGYNCSFRLPTNDIAVDEWQAEMQGLQAADTTRGWDYTGSGMSFLTSMFSQKCTQSIFWNFRELAPGGQIWGTVDQLDGVESQALVVKFPRYPPKMGFSNYTWRPMEVAIGGSTGASYKINYGLGEYDQGQLATQTLPPCWSRNETCSSDGSGVKPFLWASETQQFTNCSTNCTVTANIPPAPGGRVVYYQIQKQSSGGGGGAITRVNSTSGQYTTGGGGVSSTNLTAVNVTSGNLLACAVSFYPNTVTIGLTDTAGNTFTHIVDETSGGGGASGTTTSLYYAKNVTGNAADVITVTFTGGNSTFNWGLCRQYAGADPVSPLDASAVGFNSSQACLANSITTGTFNTVAANEVAFAAIIGQIADPSPFVGTGYTLGNFTSDNRMWSEDQIFSSTQTGAVATFGTNHCDYFQIAVATFKAGTGGATIVSPMDVTVVR